MKMIFLHLNDKKAMTNKMIYLHLNDKQAMIKKKMSLYYTGEGFWYFLVENRKKGTQCYNSLLPFTFFVTILI